MEEELKFIFESAEESMTNAVKHLEKKLLNIRAGKANTSMLGSIVVEYYGSLTPLTRTKKTFPFSESLIMVMSTD